MIGIQDILKYIQEEDLNYKYSGNETHEILDICALNQLKPQCITWVKKHDKFDILSINKSLDLLIVTDWIEDISLYEGYNIIVCDYPKECFFNIVKHFFVKNHSVDIANTAVIETKKIGKNVTIGHHSYICEDVKIGDNVIIGHNVVIECPTQIGSDSIIGSGVIIGTDGFGYYRTVHDEVRHVPHIGGVVIGERADIGANTCVDRGTIGDTVIGNDSKIDNLCHIAHNVVIGEKSYVIALSMLGGSCQCGKNSYIAPCSGVMNQLSIGENSLVGMGAVVVKNVPANKVVAGVPAKIIRDNEE
ncbi:MAG: UDP-3-O-(3-hydroxymyristoyl)glucosamine N-acyltransferase [Clostridiales bacterium]